MRNRWSGAKPWVRALEIAMVLGALGCGLARGQGNGRKDKRITTVRGKVVNQVTKEPIARALVSTAGDEYATMTDDHGEFEFKMTEQDSETNSPGVSDTGVVLRTNGPEVRAAALQARKPGFLNSHNPTFRVGTGGQSPVTLYLVPEALIVGRVTAPGSEGDVRIQCELYRHRVMEGRETWQPAGIFTTWGSGEFRFSGLEAGTYRLSTREEMDRDSLVLGRGAPMFGYPPIYYVDTTDFSAASPIVVKSGETAQVNLTVTRRLYYPVRIPVRNAPLARANVMVHPMGHRGPGWSLGYNPMQRVVEGMLPDGNYTVELETNGETTSTGIGNFVVNGAALEGTPLYLTPDPSVTVNVRAEFQTGRNGASQESAETLNRERLGNLVVVLRPLEEFGSTGQDLSAQPVEGSENRTLTIANVRPGRYRLVAQTTNGYVASVQSGEVDLLKQPLAVGIGGGAPPVEVTLRDDGAEVSGTVEGVAGVQRDWQSGGVNIQQYWRVYLVPVGAGMWQEAPSNRTWEGKFTVSNVPPGEYFVVAYEEGQRDLNLPFGDEEFLKSLEEKGRRIRVEAGEKVANVTVEALAGNDDE
jgi:hypothetical protein